MASHQRLKRLRWKGDVAWFDHGGKPRRWERLGTDPAEIQRKYDRLMAQEKTVPGTVDAMLRDYLAKPLGLAPGTLANYRVYRGHLSAVFGPLDPSAVTQADIVRYLRLCKRKTAKGEIGVLSLAYVAWMDDGRLDANPCFGVKLRLPVSKRDRLLSDEEIDRIITAGNERLAVAVELAYATGLRIGDLCRLRWADFAEGLQTAKTGVRQRWEITDDLRTLLARAKALQSRVASLYVLCGRAGKQWTPGALRDQWNTACKRAGVEDAHFHDLRAAGGTEVERQGGNAQRFLGHKHRRTTEIYLRDKRVNTITPLRRRSSTG